MVQRNGGEIFKRTMVTSAFNGHFLHLLLYTRETLSSRSSTRRADTWKGKRWSEIVFTLHGFSNGKTIWKHNRPSKAKKESLESFGTIIPHGNELLVAGGDVLTGHDFSTAERDCGAGELGTPIIKNNGGDWFPLL